MHNLLDFIRRYCYYFLFVALEIVSFVLLFRFNSFQGSVWLSSANGMVAGMNRISYDAKAFVNLQNVNAELTSQNVALQIENNELREALMDAKADTSLTMQRMQERLNGYQLINARVISNSAERVNNYLVIDKGSADGVRTEMGVVGGSGIVGIVYLVGAHHALVIPVVNRKSSISCRLRGQHYFGFLEWGGDSWRTAYLDDVPRYAKIKKGQAVETSGYSAVFPPGLFVGRISRVRNSTDGQTFRLDVVLGTNFANLRDVQVIASPYKAEIDTLQAQAAISDI